MEMSNSQLIDIEEQKRKKITLLGSTGSIGCNTLSLVSENIDRFSISALTGNSNVQLLAQQAKVFKPEIVVIALKEKYRELKEELGSLDIRVEAGEEGLTEAASLGADVVISGIVGIAGLKPTMASLKNCSILALANKESLVCAGSLLMQAVSNSRSMLMPLDSEHNAIFQVFDFQQSDSVKELILTASGGPFRKMEVGKMAKVRPEDAITHPNWEMGKKISVDSATMMNKGLEMIEAFYLFPVKEDQIKIVVHPQSIVHSMVTYMDGSMLAQMGVPDMRIPISYALGWPKRLKTDVPKLELEKIANLTFEPIDVGRFPALRVAREVLSEGGAAPITLNAANELAVEYFLEEKIGFLDIIRVIEECLEKSNQNMPKDIDEIIEVDKEARKISKQIIKNMIRMN